MSPAAKAIYMKGMQMRISNDTVNAPAAARNAQGVSPWPQQVNGLRTAITAFVSAMVLSGCLVEGGGSGGAVQQELEAALEQQSGGASSSGEAREAGATGGSAGSGSAESGSGLLPEIAALINPGVSSDHYPGTLNYSKQVDIPSCDGADAVRISTVAGIAQIANSGYRVFCIAPGDYRSYGKLALSATSGTEALPKVIRFESSEFSDDEEIFRSDISKLARMPEMDIRNTGHWILHRLAFIDVSGMPIRLSNAENIVIDRIRFEGSRNGIELRHGTRDSYIQNSLIRNQQVPQGSGNDGVCIAFMGHFKQHDLGGNIEYDYPVLTPNNSIVNNEIYNCNDGIQIVWMHHYYQIPDFRGTVIAGNDIYLDDSVRTNCYGAKDVNGDCTHMENPIDLKGGSLEPTEPVEIFDNRMWGFRKTDSNYNGPANSWGTGISAHYRSVQNIHIYENVIFDVPAAVSFTRGAHNSVIRDNIFTQVTGAGINNGIAFAMSTDTSDLGTYNNVSGMQVEGNHIIVSTDGSSTGSAWMVSSASGSSFSCNIVANGDWTGGSMTGGSSQGNNTFYNTNSGSFSSGGDSVHSSFASSNMGELCFDTKRASTDGGVQKCLPGVLHASNSPNACASDYWTVANW